MLKQRLCQAATDTALALRIQKARGSWLEEGNPGPQRLPSPGLQLTETAEGVLCRHWGVNSLESLHLPRRAALILPFVLFSETLGTRPSGLTM